MESGFGCREREGGILSGNREVSSVATTIVQTHNSQCQSHTTGLLAQGLTDCEVPEQGDL